MRTGIRALSPRSRYLRFFSAAPMQPVGVIDQLVDIDGEEHLAWGAIDMNDPDRPAIGAVHAIRSNSCDTYEFSVAVLDSYHGEGVGTLLSAVVLLHCQALGIEELHAQTLSENNAAHSLLSTMRARRSGTHLGVSEHVVEVDSALANLLGDNDSRALIDVVARLRQYA